MSGLSRRQLLKTALTASAGTVAAATVIAASRATGKAVNETPPLNLDTLTRVDADKSTAPVFERIQKRDSNRPDWFQLRCLFISAPTR